MSLMKQERSEPLPHFISSFFLFSFSKKTTPVHISLFLTEINSPLSGQISDKTQYTLVPIFTQPLHSGRIWHKVNFLSGV